MDGNGATATSCALNDYCHPLAKCTEVSNTVVCSCPAGMVGSGVGLNGCMYNTHQRCDALPCKVKDSTEVFNRNISTYIIYLLFFLF